MNDEDGEPLVNTTVLLNNAAQKRVNTTTTTDEDGFFEFNDIEPGNYTVLIDPKHWRLGP